MKKQNITKVLGFIVVAAIAITVLTGFTTQEQSVEIAYDGPPKAVIIDQLSDEFPNPSFNQQATEYLETAGYQVDFVTTSDVTVDFYKTLPEQNYKIIVIRTHGADNKDGNNVVLFTGERYQEDKYIQEQLFGQVAKATPLLEVAYKVTDDSESNWVIVNDTYRYLKSPAKKETHAENEFFAISPKLVSDSMKGRFDGTLFILGGCNTLSNPSMADSLVKKGASAIVGWDNTVANSNNDYAILNFLDLYLNQNLDIEKSVASLNDMIRLDWMPYPANFTHYQNTA